MLVAAGQMSVEVVWCKGKLGRVVGESPPFLRADSDTGLDTRSMRAVSVEEKWRLTRLVGGA